MTPKAITSLKEINAVCESSPEKPDFANPDWKIWFQPYRELDGQLIAAAVGWPQGSKASEGPLFYCIAGSGTFYVYKKGELFQIPSTAPALGDLALGVEHFVKLKVEAETRIRDFLMTL